MPLAAVNLFFLKKTKGRDEKTGVLEGNFQKWNVCTEKVHNSKSITTYRFNKSPQNAQEIIDFYKACL